jgi:hypothetical protein
MGRKIQTIWTGPSLINTSNVIQTQFPRGAGEGSIFDSAALDMDFASNLSLVDSVSGNNLIDFTRSSTATYVDSAGVIQDAAIDAPRFDHDPVTGESLGLLIEEARTNLINYSDNVNDVWWSKINLTAPTLVSSVNNPLQNADTYRISSDTNSSPHYLQRNDSTLLDADKTYTFSAIVAPEGTGVDSGKIQFRIFKIGSASGVVNFDLNTGQSNPQDGLSGQSNAIKDWEIHDYGMEPYLNGWYRVWTTFQVTGSTSSIGIVSIDDINASDASGVYSYTGSGTAGYYVAGIQVEEGYNKTSIIQTSGSTVTRAADVASITGTNFSSFYNSTEGSTFADVGESVGNSDPQSRAFVLSNGTNLQRMGTNVKSSEAFNLFIVSGGSAIDIGNISGLPKALKLGISYDSGGTKGFAEGSSTGSTTSFTTLPDRISIGSQDYTSDGYLNGHIKRLAYWSTKLSDSDMDTVTT